MFGRRLVHFGGGFRDDRICRKRCAVNSTQNRSEEVWAEISNW